MYFIIWETPSEANPAKAERPSVLPIVGANVPPSDRVFVDSDALTCLLMFCFCEWNIDTFIQIVVLFLSIDNIFWRMQCKQPLCY